MTVRHISPQVGTSIIKSLAEAAFLSSSVAPSVVAIAASAPEAVTTATVSPEISPSTTSETTSPVTTVTAAKASTVIELLFFQLWELCGYSQLPTATILPVLLLGDRVGGNDVSRNTTKNIYNLIYSFSAI